MARKMTPEQWKQHDDARKAWDMFWIAQDDYKLGKGNREILDDRMRLAIRQYEGAGARVAGHSVDVLREALNDLD